MPLAGTQLAPWPAGHCIVEKRRVGSLALLAVRSLNMPSDRNAAVRQAAVERHIEEGRARIARLRDLVAQMASRGGDPAIGERILATMEVAIGALEQTWRTNGGVLHEVKVQSVPSRTPEAFSVDALRVRDERLA
jgi:hypothetical protein